MEYLFILGNAPELAKEELKAVLKSSDQEFQEIYSYEKVYHVNTSIELDCNKLIAILGGTVKIAKVMGMAKTQKEVIRFITEHLPKTQKKSERIVFGLSWYTKEETEKHFNDIYQYSREIKNVLGKKGYKVRFVLPKKNEDILSSVVVKKQEVQEIIISQENKELILGQTLAVQDFEEWGKRDYQRPMVAPQFGMLPPKVARMMVNIGNGRLEMGSEKKTLLDPFCGTGTILAEGLLCDLSVIGSDKEPKAIESSQKNLEWLHTNYKLANNFPLLISDATHISEKIGANSIDLIVTEPYLGPLIETTQTVILGSEATPESRRSRFWTSLSTSSSRPRGQNDDSYKAKIKTKEGKAVTTEFIMRIIDGLERLYIGCLREWNKILTPKGIIVMVLPSYSFDKKEFFVKKAVDKTELLGYSIEAGPLPYSRKQAVVKRNIYILQKLTN